MSEERRLSILNAIVQDYVHTREPVGSKAVAGRYSLGVSSATIRNDMAHLEDEGLITAPHTSAGRIPTDQGYRTFVDRIHTVKPLSAAERRAIRHVLHEPVDVQDAMERAARILSQLTRNVAVVQTPTRDRRAVEHIHVLRPHAHQLLAVAILDNGDVVHASLPGSPCQDADLEQVTRHLNAALTGRDMETIATATLERGAPNEAARLLAELRHALPEAKDRIVSYGASHLARSTIDFPHTIGPVLEALEEQVVLLKILGEMTHAPRPVTVSIGHENPDHKLAETSLVAATYQAEDTAATIGVLGPTRMDYPATIAAVQAVARYLSRILGQEHPTPDTDH